MSQRFDELATGDEHLTDEEVQAIVKRYGEKQAGGDTRATVADVAEALQVEPGVVSRLLREIRTADSEKQLRERLESLEKENADLRKRAQESEETYDDFYSSSHWAERRRLRRRSRSFGIAVALAALAAVAISSQGGATKTPVVAVVAIAVVMAMLLRTARRCGWPR